MIDYEEDWIFSLVWKTEGSVAWRACLFAIPSALFSLLLVFLDDWFPNTIDQEDELGFMDANKSQIWTLSTAVLAIVLSLRTNRAMSRFWEGTGLLHQMRGEWFDSVSCCVSFSRSARSSKGDEVDTFRHTLVRLMSLCHGSALEEIAGNDTAMLEKIDCKGLDDQTINHLQDCVSQKFNRVEVVLHLTQSLITKAHEDGILKIPPPILSRVYQTLSRGFVNLLNAKKITDTRFPFPYAQLISYLLLFHMAFTPIVLSIQFRRTAWAYLWAPLFTFVPIFGMMSVNCIAMELENPFGEDPNDLPLEHFQAEMNQCLMMLLQENADLIPGIRADCEMSFKKLHNAMRGWQRSETFTERSILDEVGPRTSKRASQLDTKDIRASTVGENDSAGGDSGKGNAGKDAQETPTVSTPAPVASEREQTKEEPAAIDHARDASREMPVQHLNKFPLEAGRQRKTNHRLIAADPATPPGFEAPVSQRCEATSLVDDILENGPAAMSLHSGWSAPGRVDGPDDGSSRLPTLTLWTGVCNAGTLQGLPSRTTKTRTSSSRVGLQQPEAPRVPASVMLGIRPPPLVHAARGDQDASAESRANGGGT